jgi:hypothetical protein
MPFPNPATQFKPGNRAAVRDRKLTDLLEQALARDIGDGHTVADLVVKALLRQAKRGNLRAIREVFDRVEGRVTEAIQVEATARITTDVIRQVAEVRARRRAEAAQEAHPGPHVTPDGEKGE